MTDAPKRRGPRLIEDVAALPPAPSPAEAPEIDAEPPAAAMVRAAARPPSVWGRLFWGALGALLSMALGLWFWETVEALAARSPLLGWTALGLTAVMALALLALAARELAALSRLTRTDALREQAERARAAADRTAAATAAARLDKLYAGRPELAEAGEAAQARRGELLDADALLDDAERAWLTPLDEQAAGAVRRAARNVAATTALMPLALIDVLAALSLNLRMIREIAEIYGGRAGYLGSWRLLRAVAAHLVATGAIAVGDDVLGPALGGGVLSRLSRRFGEGVLNGALTARIGLAAMEVCRPLPFSARPRPGVGALLRDALGDLLRKDKSQPVVENAS